MGGFPYATSQNELQAHFEQAGKVLSVIIIMDRMTGKSKGFGFVEMEDEAAANNAISMFDGKDFGGRALSVNVARPMEPRRDRNFEPRA